MASNNTKRHRNECGAHCTHDHAADSQLGEQIFGNLCSVMEGYPAASAAAIKQARMMFDAYLQELQIHSESTEKDHAHEDADGTTPTTHDDAASPTTEQDTFDRSNAVISLCGKLNTVKRQLRSWVPYGSLSSSESLITPVKSETFDSTIPTFELDNFLYPEDEDVEELCEKGLVSRNYCLTCNSTKTAATQFVSHSFSRDQLLYITCFLTPYLESLARREDRGSAKPIEKVVDVGSRLGIVLTAFSYANPSIKSIVGIEMNSALCELQRRLIKAHQARGAEARASVVCANVLSEEGLAHLQSADVVILHNVFEWFSNESDQLGIWSKIRTALSRKGQWLIIAPRLDESLSSLASAFDANFSVEKFINEWVDEVDVSVPKDQFVAERKGGLYGAEEPTGGCGEESEDENSEVPEFAEQCDNIHVYRVK